MPQLPDTFYRVLFQEIPTALLLVDPDTGHILDANPAAVNLYGISREQLTSHTLSSLHTPQDTALSGLTSSSHSAPVQQAAVKISPQGEFRYLELRESRITWEGSPVNCVTVQDMTGPVQDVDKLTRFRLLFEKAPDAIFLADTASGIILDANQAAEQLLLRSRKELIGMHFTQLHPLDQDALSREHFHTHLENSLLTGKITTIEYLAQQADGTVIPIEVTAGILSLQDQTVMMGIFRDIRKRRSLEDTIRLNEERLKLVMEGTNDGLWDWNAVTNKVHFSPRWKQMLGFADEDIRDELSEWESRIHPEDRDKVFNDLNLHLQGETPFYQNEHRLRCKDGSWKWILDRGKVISRTEAGAPLRVAGAHTDIDEKKRIELENQELVRSLRAALDEVKQLSGLLPICSNCKKIRDDQGYWSQVEDYISLHSQAEFSHGICPECAKILYPKYYPDESKQDPETTGQ